MRGLSTLKVVQFTEDRVPNLYPGGDLPWQVYHTVRNAVVRACRKYGPVGPMGEVTIDDSVPDPYRAVVHDLSFWPRGDSDPDYFIVDDQYNHERYLYAELYGDDPFNAGWLLGVTAVLREHKGWGIGIKNIPDNYVLVFGKRLVVKGRHLARCTTAEEVVSAVRRQLKRGLKKWWQFWR